MFHNPSGFPGRICEGGQQPVRPAEARRPGARRRGGQRNACRQPGHGLAVKPRGSGVGSRLEARSSELHRAVLGIAGPRDDVLPLRRRKGGERHLSN